MVFPPAIRYNAHSIRGLTKGLTMVALGVFLHAIGGFAAGTFYIPFKKVKEWAWESYWLISGVFAWVIAPWLVAYLAVPQLFDVLRTAWENSSGVLDPDVDSFKAMCYSYGFGVLWGIGGITFGLSMRYLGMSLGYAVALGFCAVFGTLMVPIHGGTFFTLFSETSGLFILSGVGVCLLGIAICGYAGMAKEKELSDEEKKETIKEFHLTKGLIVAVIAGLLSACMNFGLEAGKPIATIAKETFKAPDLWKNTAVLVVVLAGGFTTNFLWCLFLNFKNRTIGNYANAKKAPLLGNYLFSAMAGVIWYLQFMFYGMGTTKMGEYDFSSWTLHMAFIIIFGNLWGLYFKEWKGSSKRTINIMLWGLAVVILSTIIVGIGNWQKS